MKRFVALVALFALLVAALLLANQRRQQSPAYLLRNYAPSDNLGFIIEDHSHPPADNIVFITDWFPYGSAQPNSGCNVTTAGSTCTLSAGIPSGPSTSGNVTKEQFAAFAKIAPTLPPSATQPTLDNLLIVSFNDGNRWTTRIYDRSNLPVSVVKAHEILKIRGFDKPPKSPR